ncbi:hypothetical protein AB1Y20_019111 [Prymnesium parvum]|uniref:SUEL-type lectin domain-containing protein n=1 Tax=Prymnesium parvum TaxID=97485 RepID=A0AB34JT28_PRYPA
MFRLAAACVLLVCNALPDHPARSLKTKRVSCAEASEGDEIVFDCGGEFISAISFASYGQPAGTCGGGFSKTSCDSKRTEAVIEDRCYGQTTCMFTVSSDIFGDPCPTSSRTKKLSAVLACGASLTTSEPEAEEDSAPVRASYGWKFIFVVFVVFGLYLGLGVAYNVKRNGASGLDAVPHLEMWKDLPFAVRDGIIFSIDTIKSKGRQQYQTYL